MQKKKTHEPVIEMTRVVPAALYSVCTGNTHWKRLGYCADVPPFHQHLQILSTKSIASAMEFKAIQGSSLPSIAKARPWQGQGQHQQTENAEPADWLQTTQTSRKRLIFAFDSCPNCQD